MRDSSIQEGRQRLPAGFHGHGHLPAICHVPHGPFSSHSPCLPWGPFGPLSREPRRWFLGSTSAAAGTCGRALLVLSLPPLLMLLSLLLPPPPFPVLLVFLSLLSSPFPYPCLPFLSFFHSFLENALLELPTFISRAELALSSKPTNQELPGIYLQLCTRPQTQHGPSVPSDIHWTVQTSSPGAVLPTSPLLEILFTTRSW